VTSYNILLIDDDSTFRKMLELRLRAIIASAPDSQIHFQHAETLAEAAAIAALKSWDLVVLDQHLPDGLGLEFLSTSPFLSLSATQSVTTNVLILSSDAAPEIAGNSLKAGAAFFLSKQQVSEPLFRPLVLGLMERGRLSREILAFQKREIETEVVRKLVSTLKHEINNPLGVVLGAAFLVQQAGELNEQQKKAAEMISASGQRIREVVAKLAEATSLEQTVKSGVVVFQVPGDPKWG